MTAIAGTVKSNTIGEEIPTVVDPDELFNEEAAQEVASSKKDKAVRFVCNFNPTLKLKLSDGSTINFKNGVGFATSKKQANLVRKESRKFGVVE